MKKTFGAARLRLVIQMLRELVVFSILAMIVACGLIQVILFGYSTLTGSSLTGPIPFLSANYLWLILFSVAVGLVAGIYPAVYLTAFRPGLIVRSTSGTGRNRPILRNILVTLQFAIAIGLLFVSFVVYSQLQYMKTKDKGFRSDGVVVVENLGALNSRVNAFREADQPAIPGGFHQPLHPYPRGQWYRYGLLPNPGHAPAPVHPGISGR